MTYDVNMTAYREALEEALDDVYYAMNTDIDVFVNAVNSAKNECATVNTPVSIGLKPEVIKKAKVAEKQQKDANFSAGFTCGIACSVMILAIFLSACVAIFIV